MWPASVWPTTLHFLVGHCRQKCGWQVCGQRWSFWDWPLETEMWPSTVWPLTICFLLGHRRQKCGRQVSGHRVFIFCFATRDNNVVSKCLTTEYSFSAWPPETKTWLGNVSPALVIFSLVTEGINMGGNCLTNTTCFQLGFQREKAYGRQVVFHHLYVLNFHSWQKHDWKMSGH